MLQVACKGENCYLRFSTARPGVKSVKPHGRHHVLNQTLCWQNLDVWFKVRVLGSRKMLGSRLGAVQRLLAPELKGGDAAAEKQERHASIQFRFCKSKGPRLSIASDDTHTHIHTHTHSLERPYVVWSPGRSTELLSFLSIL